MFENVVYIQLPNTKKKIGSKVTKKENFLQYKLCI